MRVGRVESSLCVYLCFVCVWAGKRSIQCAREVSLHAIARKEWIGNDNLKKLNRLSRGQTVQMLSIYPTFILNCIASFSLSFPSHFPHLGEVAHLPYHLVVRHAV